MDKKITLNQLAAQIADLTKSNEQTAKAFIQCLTDIVAEALSKEGEVSINGLGTFSVEDSDVNTLKWVPDGILAETVNHPFSAFEPVDLGEGVTEELLEGSVSSENATIGATPHVQEETQSQSEETESEKKADSTPTKDSDDQIQHDLEPVTDNEPKTIVPQDIPQQPYTDEDSESTYDNHDLNHQRHKALNPWVMLVTGLLAGFIIGYFSAPYIFKVIPWQIFNADAQECIYPDTTQLQHNLEEQSDTIDTITHDTIPSFSSDGKANNIIEQKPEITDTVSSRRYLTTMSRQYYGDYRFWIYIYLENKDHIKDPDRISPGTVVVIPPAEKYSIDASNPQSVAAANEKTRAIMEKLDK